MTMDKSNYVVEVAAPETCKACAMCVKRCPIDAIQLKFSTKATNKFRKAVVVDADLCIGCGVCVHKCKTKSIVLKEREQRTRPPKDRRELVNRNIEAWLASLQEKEKAS